MQMSSFMKLLEDSELLRPVFLAPLRVFMQQDMHPSPRYLSAWQVGDSVAAVLWTGGGFAEEVVAPASNVLRLPGVCRRPQDPLCCICQPWQRNLCLAWTTGLLGANWVAKPCDHARSTTVRH